MYFSFNWVQVNGSMYKCSDFIVLPDKVDEDLIFGKIHDIILFAILILNFITI